MSRSFSLPDLGEGIHEGEVLNVLVAAGDEISEGDPLLEVETDKAAVEIPSPFTGTVKDILVKAGDVVKVGDVLITFSDGKEGKPVIGDAPALEGAPVAAGPSSKREKRPVPASPATRRLARELGVDLFQISPSGPGGLVTAEDVRAFAEKGPGPEAVVEKPLKAPAPPSEFAPALPPLPDFNKWGPTQRIPFRSIRRATAKQMALAWSQIPHASAQDWVDLTKLESFRKKHKPEVESQGGKLTMTVFVLKAAATALKANPQFNATLDTTAGEVVLKNYYHIGVAVNTDNGLIVPVVRDVDRKSITELAIELTDLVLRTRDRKATLEEMQGGTFTITNIGSKGIGEQFFPIINYPEVAILGIGAARMKPVVLEEKEGEYEIVPRLMAPVILSFDHRVLDGADANRFMRIVIHALRDPDQLLMTGI
ncbi:dihydrolipoamide acetyltransferase family protein [Thermodesulfobacteriota bacterium]